MLTIDTVAQQTIHVDVEYYNQEHRNLLSEYPTVDKIDSLVAGSVSLPFSEFLTYYLFERKRYGKIGYRDYRELTDKIDRAWNDLEDWVNFTDGSLSRSSDSGSPLKGMSERIGEAIALSVINKIHDLHEADWNKIPELPGRHGQSTFDYEQGLCGASDGEYIVQVECKGSMADTLSSQSQSIRNHANSIIKKKGKIRALESQSQYKYPADIRYGAIGAIDATGPTRCWLLDPPAEGSENARIFRLLSRLRFIQNWLAFLSGRSQISASLSTRIMALGELPDPFLLNQIPLLNGRGLEFESVRYYLFAANQRFQHLCRISDGPGIGTLIRMSKNKLFFVGIQGKLLEIAIDQDFEQILSYADPGGTVLKRVLCSIPVGRARSMELSSLVDRYQESGGYYRFSAVGNLFFGRGGAIFGVVVPED